MNHRSESNENSTFRYDCDSLKYDSTFASVFEPGNAPSSSLREKDVKHLRLIL